MAYTQREYTESDSVKKFRDQMESHLGLKPADYVSKWQPQIDSTVSDILNRKDFQYDVNADALYQQYKDRYVNLGQKAMMDTMGQAATLTGGYGNSYAQMAGQQAYQGYLQGLTDKIPELYQIALDRYNQQGQDLYSRYGLLSSQEQDAFSKWQTNMNQWLSERDYLAGRFDTERGYDYGQYRDAVADDQWKANFDEDLRRFNFANKLGEFAPKASSGGGGGSYYSYNPNPSPKPQADTGNTGEFIGPFSESYMADLIEDGKVNASLNDSGNLILNRNPSYTGSLITPPTYSPLLVQPNNTYANAANAAANAMSNLTVPATKRYQNLKK